MPPEASRMCARATCAQVGMGIDAKRCAVCGYVTQPFQEGFADAANAPRGIRRGIPVSTANEIPGWEVTDYIGEVCGLTVRSRGALPQMIAGAMSTFGGELRPMTELLLSTRSDAIDRMVDEAARRGGEGVIAMRFDVTTIGTNWTEVCAYGTAVKATKISVSKPEAS